MILTAALIVGLAAPGGAQDLTSEDSLFQWVKERAEQLGPRDEDGLSAIYVLGGMYLRGEHVPQDYAEAVKWYRRAAEQGHAGSHYRLGRMYAEGKGVPMDLVRAHMWFNLAGAAGHFLSPCAQQKRDLVASRMTPAQIAEAQRLARKWKPKTKTE